jgi:signal transduction histidine kinase
MSGAKLHEGHTGDRVRGRILYPFTLVILFVVGSFLIAAYLFVDREHTKNLTDSAASVERLFLQGLENDAAMMQAALSVITSDKDIKKSFINKNRKALLKLAWPIFNNLRKNNNVTHFYFTGPDRVNFLRVHKPDEYGDTIDRITTLRATNEKVPARGIELGPLGTFTLRVVLPWYDNKTLIGYLELGEEIDHITNEVHNILGDDLLVLVNEKFLGLEQWEVGRKLLGHQDDWPRFGKSVVVGRAMKKIPDTLAEILKRNDHSHNEPLQVKEDGRNLYVTFLPLKDTSSREVGDFIVVRDVTDAKVNFRNTMIITATISVLVGGIVFAIFYVVLGKVEHDYRRQHDIELQLSRINTEHQKVIQLEKLSAMGLMIGEIAHQLNNPLVGVVNMAQLAQREVEDPERTKELLDEIGKAGKDCHGFVRRMLDFTKISCFDRKLTNMNVLVEDTLSLFRLSVGKHHKITTYLPKDAPTLDVDPVLIGHALFNLISNADHENPPDGTISVSLKESTQQGHHSGWSLCVSDDGPGLSDHVMKNMFTPFFTTHGEGTGLGLPVVHHVAILHEGWITATNTEDRGAHFELWLPVTENDT